MLGQSAAGLHSLKHFGAGKDGAGAPVQHVQLCLECASFAPLFGAHGSPAHASVVAPLAVAAALPFGSVAFAVGQVPSSFRARAPPR